MVPKPLLGTLQNEMDDALDQTRCHGSRKSLRPSRMFLLRGKKQLKSALALEDIWYPVRRRSSCLLKMG